MIFIVFLHVFLSSDGMLQLLSVLIEPLTIHIVECITVAHSTSIS